MTNPLSNNFMIINNFVSLLDQYEENIVLITQDFNKVEDAIIHLKSALDLLIQTKPLDSFQMLRILSKRMIATNHYTNNVFISIMDKAVQTGTADLLLAIPFKLNQINNENPFVFDEIWFTTVNRNKAIKSFFETYLTSDIHLLKSVNLNNVIISDTIKDVSIEDLADTFINLTVGKDNLKVNLSAFQKQTLKFTVDTGLNLPENYDNTLPLTIQTFVCIKAGIRKFMIDKSIKFTDNALPILEMFDFIDRAAALNGHTNFIIPDHFYSYKLEMISYNSGDTWWVSNILVLDSSFY